MPIRDIQISLREVGRIRCGDQTTTARGRAPRKLDRFRFTSDDAQLLAIVADLYGGTVEQWPEAPHGDQWQCYVTAERIPVMMVPGLRMFSQWYEAWSGGGIQRRCDGVREIINGVPCQCDANGERICKPTTRLSVVLPDIPGLGTWRLETHGYYAAVELGGTVELISKLVAATAETVHGTLRLTQRTQRLAGQPIRHFAVPTLDIAVTVPQLVDRIAATRDEEPRTIDAANSERVRALALASQPEPRPTFPTEQDRTAAEARSVTKLARKRTPPMGPGKRDTEPPTEPTEPRWKEPPAMPDSDRPTVTASFVAATTEPPPAAAVRAAFDSPLSDRQRTALLTLFRLTGLEDRDGRLLFAARIIGRSISSSKELTSAEASSVIDVLESVHSGTAEYICDADGRIVGARPLDIDSHAEVVSDPEDTD